MIKRIWADNYKSLRNFELELRPFNVLVGANAAGKSSVISSLAFLQASLTSSTGLFDAVSALGGWRGITSEHKSELPIKIGLAFDLAADLKFAPLIPVGELDGELNLGRSFTYELQMGVGPTETQVTGERVRVDGDNSARVRLELERDGKLTRVTLRGSDGQGDGLFWRDERLPANMLALAGAGTPTYGLSRFVADWQFIDIKPDAVRHGTPETHTGRLKSHAGNLPVLLKSLDQESKGNVCAAMRRDVPGFVDFEVQEAGGRLLFALSEENAKALPPEAVSDGTIRLLAFYALYYGQEPPSLLCFEEPETGLHPDLIETIVEYLRAMSTRTQVIVTTHNPLLLDWCKPEEVVLLDKVEGVTRAMRVDEKSQIQGFLKDWRLGELWTRDLLPLKEVGSGISAGSTGPV